MHSKITKLLIIVQLIQKSLSNEVKSYFQNPNDTSVLIVNNNYDCRYHYGQNNAFEGVKAMINHLVEDYKSGKGSLSKKPATIIMKLSLYNSGATNKCYISKNIVIYNPFILGKHDPKYKQYRNKEGDKICCLDLENTYDMQLVVEGPVGKELEMYINSQKSKGSSKFVKTYLVYFPTIKFRNIAFKKKYFEIYEEEPLIIFGYDFGKKVDLSPISERVERFRKSQFVFENITIDSDMSRLLSGYLTCNQVKFSSWTVKSFRSDEYLIYLRPDMNQLKYLHSQQRKIEGQKFKDQNHQLIYDFNSFNFTSNYSKLRQIVSSSIKRGTIVYLSIDDSKTDGSLFKIHSVIRNWTLQRSNIERSHNYFSNYECLFIIRKNKVHTSEIENLKINDCTIFARLFKVYNLLKFDNIMISNNKFFAYEPIFESNMIRSYNMTIFGNIFSTKVCIFYIDSINLVNKSMALQQNYSSSIRKWSFQNNEICNQKLKSEDKYGSFIQYVISEPLLSSDFGSSSTIETEKLKNHLGLIIDDFQVQNTESDKSKMALSLQQRIQVIHVKNAFNFELTNSKFINNEFFTSSTLYNVSYINISNITIEKNKVPYQIAYDSSISAEQIAYTPVFNILYFFKIDGFHHIQIGNIQLKQMVFESSLFKIKNNKQQLLQTKMNNNQSIIDISNIQIRDGIYLKPSAEYGSSLIHVSTINPVKFTFTNSTINKLMIYQQMHMKDDMALVVYFSDSKSQKSQFIARNLDIQNSGFQYKKGLFVVQAQKVSFDNIQFINNQYQGSSQFGISNANVDKFVVKFDKMESKGCIMDVHAQMLEINNINVDRSQSKEAAVLKLVVDQPTDLNSLRLHNNELHVLKVQNSTFTNIVSHTGSILFDIDLSQIKYASLIESVNNVVLTFDKLKVQNVFSYRSGPIFKIHNMDDEKINIINSEFKSFKSGSAEQFIQYYKQSEYEYDQDKQTQKMVLLNSSDYSINQQKRKSKLNIDNCIIDNMKVINRFINQLYHIHLQKDDQYSNENYKIQIRKYIDQLMAYTEKTSTVQFSYRFLSDLERIERQNQFQGGQLISSQNSIVNIRNSVISNIEIMQADQMDIFPLILGADLDSEVMIQNVSFSNLYPNRRGLFDVMDSKLIIKDCRFEQIHDLHYDGNSFKQQIKRQKVFRPDDNYTVYNVFDNDRNMIGDNSKQFRGGLVAYNSTVEISNNRFEKMKCQECSGLVLSMESSLLKIMNNKFINNSAYQATCVYIDGKQMVNDQLRDNLEKKGDQYVVSNSTMQISNNEFINNSAINNSIGIYMRRIDVIAIENNRFENNEAQYGSCLYSVEQNNRYDHRSIVTNNNKFINNVAISVGQIYYQNIFIYNMGSNQFKNNRAKQFSSKVFSYPHRFKLNIDKLDNKSGLVENQYVLNGFGSNQQIIPLEFVFYDEMNETINLDQYISSQNEFVSIVSIKTIKTIFSDKIKNSVYNRQNSKQINKAEFTNPHSISVNNTWINNHLKISASPLSQVVIEFETSIIKRFNKTTKLFIDGASFRLIINFRECLIGEYYDKEQNYCQKCPADTFSFNISEPCKRQEKVNLMEKAYGGYKTSVKRGAWRSKNNTQNIMECTNSKHCEPNLQRFPDASNSSGNHLCRVGHVGPLCQSCDNYGEFWNQSYQYSAKDKVCVSCSESSWTIIFFFMILIAIGLLAVFTINKQVIAGQNLSLRKKLKSIKHLLISRSHRFLMASQRILANKTYFGLKKQNSDKKYPMKLKYKERDDGYSYDVYILEGGEKTKQELNILTVDFNEIIQPTALIKIMVTYFLIFSITIQSIKDHFKDLNSIQSVFRTAGEPLKQATYSLECLIISLGIKDVPVYVVKDILTILSPLINWLVFLIIWRVILRSRLDKPVLINSLTFISFYNYPQIIRTIFPAVIRQRQDGTDYVQTDTKFIYQSQQQFYLRIFFYTPVLFLFLIVLPAMTVLFLRKNKEKLCEPDFRMKFGFLYQEYRKGCYYIEVVKVAMKVLIIMFQSIYIDSLQLQISIIQQILLVFLIIIILVKPYTQHSTNAIELQNIILCLLNMILVNSIHWSQQADCSVATIMFIVIMVVFNTVFIFMLFYLLFSQKIIEINDQIVKLKHTLLNKVPKLKSIKYFKSYVASNELNTKLKWQSLFKTLKKNRFQIKKQVDGNDQNAVSVNKGQDDDTDQTQNQQKSKLDRQQSEIEICESNQSHISNRQLLKGQNKDKNRNTGEPNNNGEEYGVSTDDIVQYFRKLGQKNKDDDKKDYRQPSDNKKLIQRSETPEILKGKLKQNQDDKNQLINKKDTNSKKNQKTIKKEDKLLEMNNAAIFKRIGYKYK